MDKRRLADIESGIINMNDLSSSELDEFVEATYFSGVSYSEQREKKTENSTANNSSSSDFKLYGMPIKSVERIVMVFCFIGMGYLLYTSKLLFAGLAPGEIGNGIVCCLGFLAAVIIVWSKKSILDIVEASVKEFRDKSSRLDEDGEEDGKRVFIKNITTNDQISSLTNLAMNIVKKWDISWTLYAVIITILYIIAYHIGLFLTALLLLIITMVIILKLPEISESFKKYLKSKTKEIPAKPPSVGVMTLFGNPIFDIVFDPGIVFVYPGIIDFLPVEVHQEPEDFETITGLFAKGDADENTDGHGAIGNIPITANGLQVLYVPELIRLKEFISAKEQAGVRDALKNMIASELRKIVSAYSFDELIGGKDKDGKKIIETIEEKLVRHLVGELIEDEEIKTAKASTEEAKAKVKEEMTEAKKKMIQNGRSDVHLLGIKIHRISISSIETSDEYLKAMVAVAAEDKQRIAETKDSNTEIKQAKLLFDAFKDSEEPKSFEDCLIMVKDDKIAREGHNIIPGLRKALNSFDPRAIAEIIRELKK